MKKPASPGILHRLRSSELLWQAVRRRTEMTAGTHPGSPLIGGRSPKRARGRSRSPVNPETTSPASVRTRSEDRVTVAARSRLNEESPPESAPQIPSFLQQTRAEIQDKFTDLAWLERDRLQQSHLDPDPNAQWAREHDVEARLRNRYLDVKPWKHNRIHLRVSPGRSDYINASPVALQSVKTAREKRYIVTQGPKDGQHGHFWQMVWHETGDTAVVVMLTQISEAGRDKCSQYFPEHVGDEAMSIRETSETSEEEESGDGFTAELRLLELTVDDTSRSVVRKLELSVGERTKTVWHLLFAGWPDWGVPDQSQRAALFALIDLSRAKNTVPASPPVVHCSAGVGRSGTFICLDHLFDEMDDGVFDDLQSPSSAESSDRDLVFDTVDRLREQRMMMVQSDAQLLFVYQVLRERWLERHGQSEGVDDAAAHTGLSQQLAGHGLAPPAYEWTDAGWPPSPGEPTLDVSRSPALSTHSEPWTMVSKE